MPGSAHIGILRNANADMNWPPVASPVVSPNTGTQKRERIQASVLLWRHVRLTAPPVKPCNMKAMQNKAAILHSSEHSDIAISEASHDFGWEESWRDAENVPRGLTMSQLSRGVTPGLPESPLSPLAPAIPGTPGNPWVQPSPQPPWRNTQQVSCPRSWHGKNREESHWVRCNTSPKCMCHSELTSLSPSAESWSSCGSPLGFCRKGQGVTCDILCLFSSKMKLKLGWHEVKAYIN